MPSIADATIDTEHTGYTVILDGVTHELAVFNSEQLVDQPIAGIWSDKPVMIINGATV